jgi:3-hydroxyisobutyrate dehydrogenase
MAEIRVGFCGLGTMGAAMAANVADAGFPLTVWNRTPGKAARAIGAGAVEASSPSAVADAADVVVICVSDTPDVEAVLFGPGGLADELAEGALIIDCSTIAPGATRQFAERLAERGVGFVDAPVSGGSEGAVKGTLTIMVGGSVDDVARAQPVLEAMGSSITHMGPVGAGQTTKAVNQVILSGVYLGVAEGMVLAMKSGLDARQVAAALAGGAAGSWVLQNRAERMIDDEYPLGFRIALHLKDLTIALEQAREVGASLPISAIAAQIEAGLVARGHGDDDNSALARAVREWSGM